MPLIETKAEAVAETYAKALYEMSHTEGGHDKVNESLDELRSVLELARADAAFGEFISTRIISTDKKSASLEKILKGRVSDLTMRFLQVLNEKGRLAVLPGVLDALDGLVHAAHGRAEIQVWTATPIEDGARQALSEQLKARLGCDVVLHCKTDAAMIGGIRLQIGDQLIDGSLENRLRKIRDQLSSTGLPAIRALAGKIVQSDI